MKNFKNIGYVAFSVLLFGYIIFQDDFSSWRRERKNRQTVENGLERLVDEYGLKIQNPTEDFFQCNYHYELTEIMVENNLNEMADKELIDKDIFMVNCIPIIQEVLDKCDIRRNDDLKLVHVDEIKKTKSCSEEAGLLIFK